MDNKEMLLEVISAKFIPKGFKDEAEFIESIVHLCKTKRTVLLTGNYVLKEGPNTESEDKRLLGKSMLLSVELCARVYRRCLESSVRLPTIAILPNDIVPGTFSDNNQVRAFKAKYLLPKEISTILAEAKVPKPPIYFFTRDFDAPQSQIQQRLMQMRKKISEGEGSVVVIFESFVQNLASSALGRGKIQHRKEVTHDSDGSQRILSRAIISDSYSGEEEQESTMVTLTNPNGAPFCSFLAATLFREFERLGFQQIVSSFVVDEYPCVDKAAAAYKYLYGGKMGIRNIHLDGRHVIIDNTVY